MFETAVIIPTFNNGKYLDRCLRSVLSQENYSNFEIICINDGSTDETKKVLDQYRDEIRIITNETNHGLPYSLNKGIKSSKSQFIVRVDSDDYVSKKFLDFLSFAMRANPAVDAVACDYEVFAENEPAKIVNSNETPIACGIMFRRDLLFEIGLYNTEFAMHEDVELMSRYLKKYKVERLPIPLYRYRMHDSNMTKNMRKSSYYLSKLKDKG
jgi:glycosyltransferase involved in cell wall biosynthesis